MQLIYTIENSGDETAGLPSYTEEVHIQVASGDPGGDEGEFAEHMRDALADWFDGAKVSRHNTQMIDYDTTQETFTLNGDPIPFDEADRIWNEVKADWSEKAYFVMAKICMAMGGESKESP